jgi:hypothetical protein
MIGYGEVPIHTARLIANKVGRGVLSLAAFVEPSSYRRVYQGLLDAYVEESLNRQLTDLVLEDAIAKSVRGELSVHVLHDPTSIKMAMPTQAYPPDPYISGDFAIFSDSIKKKHEFAEL